MDEPPSVLVRGDDHLDTVVSELVTMALERTDGGEVVVDVAVAALRRLPLGQYIDGLSKAVALGTGWFSGSSPPES